MYNGVRKALFMQVCYFNSDFMSYDEDAKLRFLFNDDAIVSKCAKFKYVCKYAQRFTRLP